MVELELSPSQITEIMGRLPYFAELGNAEISRLAEGAQEIVLKKKEILFRFQLFMQSLHRIYAFLFTA